MNKNIVFQFSSIKNAENYQKIKKIFNDLNVRYEDTKVSDFFKFNKIN